MKKLIPIVSLVLVTGLIMGLAACGSSKDDDKNSRSGDRHTTEGTTIPELEEYVTAEYPAYETEAYWEEDAYYGVDDADMHNAVTGEISDYINSGSTPDGYNTNDVNITYNTRMLIRRVTMEVETLRYTDVVMSVRAQTVALGGYVESSSEYGTGEEKDLRTGVFVIRVPSEYLDELINSFGGYCTVLSQNESTEDVTLAYSDIESHIEALRTEQNTLMELLANTDNIDYILTLQTRLTQLSYEIESYESQARILSNLSSFGTLTLTVRETVEEEEEVTPTPTPEDNPSFREEMRGSLNDTLKDIRKGARNIAVDFAGVVPYILIVLAGLVPVIIIVVIVVVVHKKHKRRDAKIASETNAAKTVENALPATADATIEEKTGETDNTES